MDSNTKKRKIAFITGANSGFGYALTKMLLSKEWDVIALIRSDMPSTDIDINLAISKKYLRIYRVDLSDFKMLKVILGRVKSVESRIDILFNNAGVMLGELQDSPQGRDLHFEVNTVVPYILTQELKDQLMAGDGKTIVNTSSITLSMVKNFDVGELEHPKSFKKIFGPYAASKLALSLWGSEYAKTLKQEGVKMRDVCPGSAKTAMTAGSGLPTWLMPIRSLFFPGPIKGAEKIFEAAFGPFQNQTGIFISKGKVMPIKFHDFAPSVLAKVDAVYRENFLAS